MHAREIQRLAKRIRMERLKRGWSANELARRARLAAGTVTRLELGEIRAPHIQNLLKIAAVLEIPAADIFVMGNLMKKDELPSFLPYLRAKYGSWPESARRELHAHFEQIVARYGAGGPKPGEDEYVTKD